MIKNRALSCACTVNLADLIKAALLNAALFQRKYVVYNIPSACYAVVQTMTTALKSCSGLALHTCATL